MATNDRPKGSKNPDDDTYVIEDTGESLADFQLNAGPSATAAAAGSAEVESLREEARKAKDQYLRTLADFENFRKRSEREKTDFFKFALTSFVKEVLPVLDNFERAFSHAPAGTTEGEFGKGVDLIYKQFWDVLLKNGLTAVDQAGVPFDPNMHEAVVSEEDPSLPSHTVKEILQKGYFLNDRLLRPAMVKVAVGGSEKASGGGNGQG